MARPSVLIVDRCLRRAQRLRFTLASLAGEEVEVAVAERAAAGVRAGLLVACQRLDDACLPPSAPAAVVKARWTLTRRSWERLSALSGGAVLEVERDLAAGFREALQQLGRADLRLEHAVGAGLPAEPLRCRACAGGCDILELDPPEVAPGVVAEVLWRLGRLDARAREGLRRYMARLQPVPGDAEFLLGRALEAREAFERMLGNSAQAALQFGPGGEIVSAGGALEGVLQRRRGDLLGRRVGELCPELGRLLERQHTGEGRVRQGGRPLTARVQYFAGAAPPCGGLIELDASPAEAAGTRAAVHSLADIVGHAPTLQKAVRLAARVGGSEAAVLLIGESGTGKELFAQAIHNLSRRRGGPFVPINCAAIPEALIESELFGYEAGSFTGASRSGRPSLFERANRGTVFLDELGDMSLHVQAALLRVLEEGRVTRVGGNRAIPVDVRVIAATNWPLEEMLADGRFRRDLYHRLCVIPIRIPPLRERPEDIPVLVGHFLAQLGAEREIPAPLMHYLRRYRWPGNVRELMHCVEYLIMLGDEELGVESLPPHIVSHIGISPVAENVPEQARLAPWDSAGEEAASLGAPDMFILQAVWHANQSGRGLGRRALARQAIHQGFCLSEAEVRTRLQALKQRGTLMWNRGRGGAKLTPLGQRLVAKSRA